MRFRTAGIGFVLIGLVLISACAALAPAAPIGENELHTLVAGSMTAVAQEVGLTMTYLAPPTETPTATATLTQTPTLTEAPTLTPTVQVVMLQITGNTNCRRGASTYFPVITTFSAGTLLEVLGRNPAGDYFYVRQPEQNGQACWIWDEFATVLGDTGSLQVFTPVPTPEATQTATLPPQATFSVEYSGLTSCGSGYAANFTITNNGILALQSIRIQNYVQGIDTPFTHTSDSFTQWSHNKKYATMTDVAVKGSAIVSTCDPGGFTSDPTGLNITAEVYACPGDGLTGVCSNVTLNYVPH